MSTLRNSTNGISLAILQLFSDFYDGIIKFK